MSEDRQSQRAHFRTACDPCSTAKVRCDKKHPSCDRCVQMNARCMYSESRKHGKKAWRRKLASDRRTRAATSTETAASQLETMKHIVPATALTQADWGPLFSELSQPVIISTQDAGLFSNDQQRQVATTILSPSWPFDQYIGTDVGPSPPVNWNVNDLSLSEPPSSGDSLSLPGLDQTGPSVTKSSREKRPSPDTNTRTSAHDCEARAISILRLLQNNEMSEGATSCTTTQYDALNLSPSFDRVLATNKLALGSWRRLMECTCSQCPHLTLLYVAILSKMLFWYHIVSEKSLSPGRTGQDGDGGGSPSSCDSPEASPPPIAQFDVCPTTVRVGLLDIDQEDQATMRRVIFLRELRCMEKALSEFSVVDDSNESAETHYIVRRARKLSTTGISYIQEELQTLIQNVNQIR